MILARAIEIHHSLMLAKEKAREARDRARWELDQAQRKLDELHATCEAVYITLATVGEGLGDFAETLDTSN